MHGHRQRQPGQRRVGLPVGGSKGQRHQRRARLNHSQAELFGQPVAYVSGANLGDGQTAGGHHHRAGLHLTLVCVGDIVRPGRIAVCQTSQTAGLPARDFAAHGTGLAFAQQHIDQVLRAAVAKHLPFVFFMEWHAVFLHQRNEILRRVTAEGTAREHGVLAQKMCVWRARVYVFVGEVAAPAT